MWTRTFAEVAAEYSDVATDHAYIDAECMWMVKNPEWFDVAVTPNLFGDIITALRLGAMGQAAWGSPRPEWATFTPGKVSMFEPIHGSAPKYRDQNKANPLATVMAISMLLDHLGENEASKGHRKLSCRFDQSGKVVEWVRECTAPMSSGTWSATICCRTKYRPTWASFSTFRRRPQACQLRPMGRVPGAKSLGSCFPAESSAM